MRIIDADKLKQKCQKTATEAWKMKIKASIETTLNQFIDWIDQAEPVDAVPVGDVFALAIALNKEIEVLGLSVRAYHALSRWGCRTVGDVYRLLKSGEIKKVRNLGDKSIGEIEDGLYEYLPYLWQTEGR